MVFSKAGCPGALFWSLNRKKENKNMNRLSGAYVLSTIVGLICNYQNEKRSISADEYKHL